MTNDPKILGLAILGGIIPSVIWLWFWLGEDKRKPEPLRLLLACFLAGVISVIFVLPLEKLVQSSVRSYEWKIIGWAGIEEIVKYLVAMWTLHKTIHAEDPVDWPIYLITTALGFAAIENTLFLIKPLSLDQATVSLLTGQLRFLGATLLHTVASGIIGISIGLSLYMNKWQKKLAVLMGIVGAIALHSVFNFFIMSNEGNNFIKIFGFLWVVTIIVLLVFEKLRRMSGEE